MTELMAAIQNNITRSLGIPASMIEGGVRTIAAQTGREHLHRKFEEFQIAIDAHIREAALRFAPNFTGTMLAYVREHHFRWNGRLYMRKRHNARAMAIAKGQFKVTDPHFQPKQ